MKRRTFCSGACAGLLAGPVFGATDLPLPIDIPDREGESTLLPAVGNGPQPLIYMSHRLTASNGSVATKPPFLQSRVMTMMFCQSMPIQDQWCR